LSEGSVKRRGRRSTSRTPRLPGGWNCRRSDPAFRRCLVQSPGEQFGSVDMFPGSTGGLGVGQALTRSGRAAYLRLSAMSTACRAPSVGGRAFRRRLDTRRLCRRFDGERRLNRKSNCHRGRWSAWLASCRGWMVPEVIHQTLPPWWGALVAGLSGTKPRVQGSWCRRW
jgi:hypothetical protein